MILTCPRCATRYLVDDGEMRPEGRKVKCGACGEEWRVAANGEIDPPLPAETAVPYGGGIAPNVTAAPVFEVVGQDPSPSGAARAASAEPPVLESLFVSPITTDSKPAKPQRSSLVSNLVLALVILAVLVVAAFAFRMEIVRIAPKTAPIYSALGIPMKAPALPPAKPPPPAAASPHG